MLAVASTDVQGAREALRDYHDRGLTDAERAAADLVLDFDADEMTCPACLTTFATGPQNCPDCGLFLGG